MNLNMKTTSSLSVLLLLLGFTQLQRNPPRVVEQTLGGLTVGTNTIHDVERRFGRLLTVDQGRYAVVWPHQCEVFFDTQEAEPPSGRRILNIQLLNLGAGHHPGSPCGEIATGQGLKLSDSPARVEIIYGAPTARFKRKEIDVARYVDSSKCVSGRGMTTVRNMFVEWSHQSGTIQSISVSAEAAECDDLQR